MQRKDGIVGYIYGDVGSTEFNFVVNGQKIRKFDYIYAPHKEGNTLAQVMDIKQHSNLKFEDATSLRFEEITTTSAIKRLMVRKNHPLDFRIVLVDRGEERKIHQVFPSRLI